ncbi:hypothetical protein DW089_06725 [Acidaminococcus sp. AM05-11]|jgi:hypothetical protein|uniref:hypothetical protein n=1 Tax=Acidaminococcus sp. AM05-11 TaxID=2291997 RepID=UPI000E4AAD37|nr:hypothetical protein [Acidaminococcus sp. AM05-11]RHK01536.1 hypothetical protein DW089_06725 [Acidaminococcus sp. AM05-11]
MPLPFLLGAAALLAGAAGVKSAAEGVSKMKEANERVEEAKTQYQDAKFELEDAQSAAVQAMDQLGERELEILRSFEEFSQLFAKIKNKPTFAPYERNNVKLPNVSQQKLQDVSVGAEVLLSGLGGAGLGAAGGLAAAGATTAAVAALGTASTGTAIASLSGAAATNATLAALGGGALAAGGGGIALGSALLGAGTLGVGLLVGGFVVSLTGDSMTKKADEIEEQLDDILWKIDSAESYLSDLESTAKKYHTQLKKVQTIYATHLKQLSHLIRDQRKTNWQQYTPDQKLLVENTVLLVGLLYSMCKVQLVLKSQDEDEPNTINTTAIKKSIHDSKKVLADKFQN